MRPIVRRFDIEVGRCSQCRRRVQGRHLLQTSDALGAAGAQLGPGVVALVVELHTEMGVPLAKVAHVLRTTFGLQVTPGGLAHLLHRTARDAAPTYTALCEQVRNSPVVTPDETGGGRWPPPLAVGLGHPGDERSTPFAPVAGSTMPPRFWGPTSPCARARRVGVVSCSDDAESLDAIVSEAQCATIVPSALGCKRSQTGAGVNDRAERARSGIGPRRLVARLGRLIDAPPPLDDAERLCPHLATEFAAVFLFLWDLSPTPPTGAPNRPSVPPSLSVRSPPDRTRPVPRHPRQCATWVLQRLADATLANGAHGWHRCHDAGSQCWRCHGGIRARATTRTRLAEASGLTTPTRFRPGSTGPAKRRADPDWTHRARSGREDRQDERRPSVGIWTQPPSMRCSTSKHRDRSWADGCRTRVPAQVLVDTPTSPVGRSGQVSLPSPAAPCLLKIVTR